MSAKPDQTQPRQHPSDSTPVPSGLEATTHITEPLKRLDELESLIERGAEPRLAVTGPPGASANDSCPVQDDEVSQYMASLMERYGIRQEPDATPAVTLPASPPPAQSETSDNVSEPPVQPPPQRQPARAPELAKDMDSLRELANESARSAVNLHLGGQIVAAAYTKLTLAIVAIFSSALCAFSSGSVASPFYFVAVGAGLASIYWVAQFWRLSGELRELIPSEQPPAASDDSDPTKR